MKKIISLLTLCLLFSSACKKDFLDQADPNSLAVQDYFRTENDVASAINGCYLSLRSPYALGETSGLFTDERSDDMVRPDAAGNSGEPFQFSDFSIQAGNSYLKNHWSTLYLAISRCNIVLSNIDKVAFANLSTKEQYKAEAKFIRALVYFELVRKWGAVPISIKQLNSVAEAAAFTFRADEKEVYAQIVADLTDAVNSPLPNLQTDSQAGKISKAAAYALLGKVYLTMATTIDPANRQTNLQNAKNNLISAFGLKKFANLKDIPYADVFDQAKQPTGQELIFQIVNVQGDLTYSSSIAALYQVRGETINSLKPATAASFVVKRDLINEYETGDPRMAYSVKFANDAIVKDYFITKFRDASTSATVNGYGGNDWVILRYADVILMLAEVNYYLGDSAAAINYIDMVRARAGMPAYATALNNPAYSTKYSDLKLAILHERRVEFAFEHMRWFDLLRFFTNSELVSFFKAKSQVDYGLSKLSNFSAKDRYFPIPFDEYKLNPDKMYQNLGY